MNRRQYLRLGCGTATAGLLAGCSFLDGPSTEEPPGAEESPPPPRSPEGSPPPEDGTALPSDLEAPASRHGVTFRTVHHAVDDLGMDPAGETPIDDALDEAYGDRTLVAFPPGEYLVTRQHTWDREVEGFGLLGLGVQHTEVEFVFPKGNREAEDPANYWFLRVESGSHHHLENVTIQQTDDKVTGVGTVFYQSTGLHVEDVELAGFNPMWAHDPGFGIIAAITDRDGVGVIRRFTCVDGGVVDLYPKRKIPIGSYRNHRGELRILEPHIANSGEHSVYVSRTRGCVRVEDGRFVNNDNTNLRMSGGGHPEKRSWAKNCRIVIDTENAENLPSGERYEGARGIWVEAGSEYDYGYTDLLLEDVSVVARSNARPAVLLLIEHSHGAVTVRNCSFRSEVEGATVVDARSPFGFVERPYGVTMDGVSVATSATETASGFATVVDSRPDTLLRDVEIRLAPGNVDGLLLTDADGTRVLNTEIAADLSELGESVAADPSGASGRNVGIVIENTSEYTTRNVDIRVPAQEVRSDAVSGEGEEVSEEGGDANGSAD